jgi:Spy/CpxP family protein refolding chaperone
MSAPRLLAAALLLAAPWAVARAQTTPQPSPVPVQSGTVTGPNAPRGSGMWRLVEALDGITPAQRQQLEAIRVQYMQSHPANTMPDRSSMQSVRTQVLHVLTPTQRTQLRSEVQQLRARHAQQGMATPSPE